MAVYGAFEPGSFNAWTLNLFTDIFVTAGVARGMQVTAPGGMQVNVTLDGTANDGVCYLPNGCFLRIDSVQNFAVPNNTSGGTRTDAIVAFVDPSGVTNPSVSLTYVTNWASGFTPPSQNQLVVALVSVPNNAVAISTGNITNNANAAKLTGAAGGTSNSMVAADGIGLTVQDNTSASILSVVLTGLTNNAGRSIAIQTTDVSAIGHQSTFDQAGNLIVPNTIVAKNLSTDLGRISTTGAGVLKWNNPLSSGNQIMDLQQQYAIFSDNAASTFAGATNRLWIQAGGPTGTQEVHIGPRSGNVALAGLRVLANNMTIDSNTSSSPGTFRVQGGIVTSLDSNTITTDGSGGLSIKKLTSDTAKITSDGNGTLTMKKFNSDNSNIVTDGLGNLNMQGEFILGAVTGGHQCYLLFYTSSNRFEMGVPLGGASPQAINFETWDGTTARNTLSLGAQVGGALSWIDNSANFATQIPGSGIPTTRNNTPLSAPIFTGSSNPVNPPTGSVWVKA